MTRISWTLEDAAIAVRAMRGVRYEEFLAMQHGDNLDKVAMQLLQDYWNNGDHIVETQLGGSFVLRENGEILSTTDDTECSR